VGFGEGHTTGGEARTLSTERTDPLGWLVGGRFLLIGVSLAITLTHLTHQVGRRPGTLLADPPTVVLLAALPLNLLYWLLGQRLGSSRRWLRLQVALDLVLVSLLIYLTGGVASNLRFLYFAPLLAASTLFGLAGGLLCASAATISVSVLTLLHYFAFRQNFLLPLVSPLWSPTFTFGALEPQLLLLAGQAVSFYLVAVLSGTLAARLRQVRILNQEILEHLSEGIMTIDREGRVAFLNQRARELLHLPLGEHYLGRPWEEVSPEHLRPPLREALERIRLCCRPQRSGVTPPAPGSSTGSPAPSRPPGTGTSPPPSIRRDGVSFEVQLTPLGAEAPLPVEVSCSPLSDDRGRLRGVTVVLGDLSERRRMESALRQAERLQALQQAAAGIAHEIRNPIASIRASAQELLNRWEGPGAESLRERLLRVLMMESDRLNNIVTDFLTYARLRPPAVSTFPLRQVLERVVTLLEKQAGPHHRIVWRCPEDLLVRADQEQLVQVFLNLGLNGLEAMPEGGALRFVAEECPDAGGEARVVVWVADEGPGIDPQTADRIFEPFFTTKAQGTGMGLALVRRILEAQGGRVTLLSAGEGSTAQTPPADLPAGPAGTGAVFRVELPGLSRAEPHTPSTGGTADRPQRESTGERR